MQNKPLKFAITSILSVLGGVFLLSSHAEAASISISQASSTANIVFTLTGYAGQDYAFAYDGTCEGSNTIGGSPASVSFLNYNPYNANSGNFTLDLSVGTSTCTTSPNAEAIVQGGVLVGGSTGGLPIIINNSSRFIDPYYPPNGSFSSTTPTIFQATYNFNCNDFGNYDLVSFEIKDVSDPSFLPVTFPQSINICGQNTYQNSVALRLSDQYLWRPVMYSSTGSSTPIYGNYYSFLATSTPNYTPFSPFVGATFGTSTLGSSTNLLGFLNVPQLLQTKVPFAYFFQIASGLITGLQSSSTNAIPAGTFTWHNTQNGTTTFDMFSVQTVEYYLNPTLIALWRAFLLIVLYVEFGYALYTRAKALHII